MGLLLFLAFGSAAFKMTNYRASQMLFSCVFHFTCRILIFGQRHFIVRGAHLWGLQVRFEDIHNTLSKPIKKSNEENAKEREIKTTRHEFYKNDKVWVWNTFDVKNSLQNCNPTKDGPYTTLTKLRDIVVWIKKSPSSKPSLVHCKKKQISHKLNAFDFQSHFNSHH